jgi:hypothetical protein
MNSCQSQIFDCIFNITRILQKIQLDDKFLKKLDIFGKKDKIIISKIISLGKKRRELKMKNESGKSPFEWIITIAVGLIIAGVIVAMVV